MGTYIFYCVYSMKFNQWYKIKSTVFNISDLSHLLQHYYMNIIMYTYTYTIFELQRTYYMI